MNEHQVSDCTRLLSCMINSSQTKAEARALFAPETLRPTD